MIFRDRSDGGKRLAKELHDYANRDDVIVLGLPRGGVPVAYEVARELQVPLDVFSVRKLGVPGHEELAMGAIASGGTVVFNDRVMANLNLSQEELDRAIANQQKELERRDRLYRQDLPPLDVRDRVAILVDDGLATGASMRVAAKALREHNPKQIIAAVPVSAEDICQEDRVGVDRVICAETPKNFCAVGIWYDNFSQTTDEEVQQLLDAARSSPKSPMFS